MWPILAIQKKAWRQTVTQQHQPLQQCLTSMICLKEQVATVVAHLMCCHVSVLAANCMCSCEAEALYCDMIGYICFTQP